MKKLCLLIMMLGFCVVVYADDINQRTHLSPSVQLKVNHQLAKSYIQGQTTQQQTNQTLNNTQGNNGNSSTDSTGGAQMSINNFSNAKQAPKEAVVAVRGDIINICFHCK